MSNFNNHSPHMPVNSYTRRVVAFGKQNTLFKKLLVLSFLSFFFFSTQFIQAQSFRIDKPVLPIDSLKNVLPLLHDSGRVDCLNELASSCTETFASDSALDFARQAYAEASLINYIKGLGDACLQYGVIYYWHLWNSPESEKYYRQAISWYQKIPDNNGLGHGFRCLGLSLLSQGFPDEAMKAIEQSIGYFRKTGNQVMLADLTDLMGDAYGKKGDFEKHFEYVKNAMQEKKRIGDKRGMFWSYYRLAHIYETVGDYETALDYFRQSFQVKSSQSINRGPFRSMGNIFLSLKNYDSSIYYFRKGLQNVPSDGPAMAGLGKVYLIRKEYDKALYYLEHALNTFQKTNSPGAYWVLVNIGKTYVEMKNYPAALKYARQCLTMRKQINFSEHNEGKPFMPYAYEILWKVYEDLKQKDSAYFYYRKFVTLKDSFEDARLKLQHLQKLALYKVETKEEQQQARIDLLHKDNQIKHQQLQKESLMKEIFAGSLAALILLSIIIYRNVTLKRKNEKNRRELVENELQIQKLESEKINAELQQQAIELEMQALRAKMNPHFIFNCLSSINRFILKNETEAASDYLTKFSRLIRMVLTNSKKAFINLEDELDMLRLYLDMERLRFKNSFEYNISFKNEIDPENIFIPPLLLQPFAENAIWHGLMHKQGERHLEIALSIEKKILTCMIMDDGIGRNKAAMIKSKSTEKQKSMGLQITTDRLALLNKDTEIKTFFEIEDVTDDEGNVAGTRVILKMQYKDMVEAYA
jgi:tetratricopeptide (TPR) repeat protein